MDVVIAYGRRIVSEKDRRLAEEKIERLAHRFPDASRAEVRFSEERNPRIAAREWCEVLVAVRGRTLRARTAGSTPLEAVDRAVEKLEHQLESLKGRLVARSQPRHRPAGSRATRYQRVRTA